MADQLQNPEHAPRPQYRWPWFVAAAVVLAIVLAVLWMSKEVQRIKRIREANPPPRTAIHPAPHDTPHVNAPTNHPVAP
jgi:hypothetical protein